MEENNTPTNDGQLTLEGLQESLGIKAAEDPPAPTPTGEGDDGNTSTGTPTEPKEPDAQGENSQTPPAGTQQPKGDDAKPLPVEQLNKEAYAFANMRTDLKKRDDVISQLGDLLGIKGKPEEILEGIQKITTASQAKKQGVPPEILERLTSLEAEKMERAANDRKAQVYGQIQTFQKNMQLESEALNTFLGQLAQAGKNPFERDVDLKSEYLVMNFDRLQKEAIDAALEAQAKRDAKAANHSTTVDKKVGTGDTQSADIKTLDDLDAFLRSNVK